MQRRSFLALLGLGVPAATAVAKPASAQPANDLKLDRITARTVMAHRVLRIDGAVFDVNIKRRK
ncbi:hypothetical protein EN759_00370 [Mesorhizobium sp. M00.F.Ca.ET.038.03.1.1]|nr:hypothetical protein EN759_00370 [Mesorhizobium sp. M00.F.Ca.ET.038.03.1.1]TIW02784.1 MAG: hypothetical protein E5V77_05125 [Mesorhizobium sp.]